MEGYFAAKAKLFTPSYAKAAVICIDDDWGKKLFAQVTIPTISIGSQGDWQTQLATSNSTGFTTQEVQRADGTNFSIEVNMLGAFNAVNASCALAASEILGLPLQQGIKSIRNIRASPGRLEEVIVSGLARVIVDYAHTPDAVATALNAIRESGVRKLITVIGCGGDRDSSKRPIMGRVASQLSDVVIITDDNPRSEEPAEIRRQIMAGIASDSTQVFEVANRREAIARALNIAQQDDVVAILGKGHESGQEINGEIFPFDDRLVAVQESELA
jgi:UDP-N-acetylmuramoyl-L-alanyl-D-glutamate--2,6-diaminopimelate ligase